MKLRYSPTSPYVRKVTITALETGLESRMERVPTNVWDPDTDIGQDNPLGKVPTLITDDGLILCDSSLICEYLDSLHGGRKLFPAEGTQRWRALARVAIADGIVDAGVSRMLELRRPENERSPSWIVRQQIKVDRGMLALEADVANFEQAVTIGEIAIGCLLGFLDFRMPDFDWQTGHPRLAAWWKTLSQRPSFAASVPHDL